MWATYMESAAHLGVPAANVNPAAHRHRVALDAPPGSKPEVRAFDEAVQRRRELRWSLRPSELESHVVSAEYRVGRPEDARCRVALEGVDPRLVGLVVDAEANKDAIIRPVVFERWLADSHDQHADSQYNRCDARALRPAGSAQAATARVGCCAWKVLASIARWPHRGGWRREPRTRGYISTGRSGVSRNGREPER